MTTRSSQLGWSVVETGVAKRLIVFNGKTMPGATLTSLWEALEDTAQNGEPQMTNLFSSEEDQPGKVIKMLKWSNLMGQLRFWDLHLTRVTSMPEYLLYNQLNIHIHLITVTAAGYLMVILWSSLGELGLETKSVATMLMVGWKISPILPLAEKVMGVLLTLMRMVRRYSKT